MASSPFNALMVPAQVGAALEAGFEHGKQAREQQMVRSSMARLAANPDDEEAAQILAQVDPRAGLSVIADQRERREQGRFKSALGDYYAASRPTTNALAMPQTSASNPTPALGGTMNAFAPAEPGAFPVNQPTGGRPVPTRGSSEGSGLAGVLGQPQDAKDAAFMRMLSVDPKAAFEIDSQMRDRAADHLKLERDAFDFAISHLGGVDSEESYQEALGDIQEAAQAVGINIEGRLPPRYPGAQGLRAIRLQALDAKDQLTYFLREDDTKADNARADRNTDSMIDTRRERVDIYRGNTEADNARADRNTTSVIENRNRPRGKAASGGGSKIVDVATVEQARALPKGTRFRTPNGQVKVR